MPEPKDYKHIAAWGTYLGSYDYYIKNEQQQAHKDHAPLDAIHRTEGQWYTVDSITRPEVRAAIDRIASGLPERE